MNPIEMMQFARDLETFKKVRVANHSVEWEGGQDIAPHELYNNSISV